ncbi:MAG TPA: diguanylate cyclase [Candidatus Eremiobacteraceae bacterium]|nr:diguanylate cyclase [Candidatus Eremiobacteraceae bacterium]
MTVNVTCTTCDGSPPCAACAAAAQSISAAGFTVHHSSRYAALRAATAGTYGFDACVLPIRAGERAIADAAGIVLAAKRVTLVLEEGASRPDGLPAHFATVNRRAYEAGSMPTRWLTDRGPIRAADDASTQTLAVPDRSRADDELRATRRVSILAHAQRERLAAVDGGPAALDMMALLEDEVGWARASGIGFGLVLLHLGGLTDRSGGDASDATIASVVAALRVCVRRGDAIACKNDDFIMLLPESDAAGAAIAALRVAQELAAGSPGIPSRPRRAKGLAAWSAGIASCPADGLSREALIARATAELRPLDQWIKEG